VPIYEFDCGSCGARFEALVGAGTETATCRECRAEGGERVMSAPGRAPRLVKSAGENRRAEDARGVGRGGAKERFKEARSKARESSARRAEGGKR
jgi:putative FmdB family regulatory protein